MHKQSLLEGLKKATNPPTLSKGPSSTTASVTKKRKSNIGKLL